MSKAGLRARFDAAVDSRSAEDFVDAFEAGTAQWRVPTAQASLTQLSPSLALDFLLSCLTVAARHRPGGEALVSPLASLTPLVALDAPPAPPELRRRALEIALAVAEADPKGAATVLAQYAAEAGDASAVQVKAVERLGERLLESEKYQAMTALHVRCPSLAEEAGLSPAALVTKLRDSGFQKLAASTAWKFGFKEWSRELCDETRASNMLKAISSNNPFKAIFAAGKKEEFRKQCIGNFLQGGMADLAKGLAEQWNVSVAETDAHREAAAARRSMHFQLPESVDIVNVSTEAEVELAFKKLRSAEVIGFDTESTRTSKVILMQLATPQEIFLIDLVPLNNCTRLGEEMIGLLTDRSVTTLSFAGAQDVAGLARVPGLQVLKKSSVHDLAGWVDLQALFAAHRAKELGISKKQALQGLGLAALAQEVLGQPVDKQMVASDWLRRPLMSAQARYASLDAWVLIKIYEKLRGILQPTDNVRGHVLADRG